MTNEEQKDEEYRQILYPCMLDELPEPWSVSIVVDILTMKG